MSPLEIQYTLRYPEAQKPDLATHPILHPLWPTYGKIRPNACPAIKSANRLGVLLFTHHPLSLQGPRDFSVELIALADQTLLSIPGIMGSLDSTVLFAKVDVGISVWNLPCAFLCTSALDIEASQGLIMPSVLYSKGFTGPLFVPVAAHSPCEIGSGYPLAQLIPLSETPDLVLKPVAASLYPGDGGQFEGLLCSGWSNPNHPRRSTHARKLLELLAVYTEAEVWRSLNE